MTYKTEQEKLWASDFNQGYIDRNNSERKLQNKIVVWTKMLRASYGIKSVREYGCGQGLNLVALKTLLPNSTLSGYEINEKAAKKASDRKIAEITQKSILEKINDNKVDLTFTYGVLIHINPDHLDSVYANLVNGSNRYVLVAEYYNPTPTKVSYRGYENQLFKRDFAGDLIDNYKMKLIDYGFVYKRDNLAPQCDISWFLLEK